MSVQHQASVVATALLMSVSGPGISVAQEVFSDTMIGYWRANDAWSVMHRQSLSGDGYCVAQSSPINRGDGAYSVSLILGQPGAIRLHSSSVIPDATQASVEFSDGGGIDLYALEADNPESGFSVSSVLTSGMMNRLLNGIREAPAAVFTVGSQDYFIPGSFEEAYRLLVVCERRRAGLTLGD